MATSETVTKKYWKGIAVAILFAALFLIFMLFVMTKPAFISAFNFSNTGNVGDTINGITAPFIGVSVAILTFLAFYMQFKANETHNIQFNIQSLEKEREKHENKILFLIKKNRDIAENMSIGIGDNRVEGAKCFSRMFNEFRAANEVTRSFYADEIEKNEISKGEIINISYIIFYNGVGEMSNVLNKSILKNTPRLTELLDIFSNVSRAWLKKQSTVDAISIILNNIEYNKKNISEIEYCPFDGHTTRLGQYFRNLFHILNYTYNIDPKIISKIDGYELIKSLRSQLSSHEQILIYFNSLSLYGKPLRDNGFINDYKLIKNMPLPLVKFSGDIPKCYAEIKFEWDEILERA